MKVSLMSFLLITTGTIVTNMAGTNGLKWPPWRPNPPPPYIPGPLCTGVDMKASCGGEDHPTAINKKCVWDRSAGEYLYSYNDCDLRQKLCQREINGVQINLDYNTELKGEACAQKKMELMVTME